LLFFISSSQLHAQWGQNPWVGNTGIQPKTQSSLFGSCSSIDVTLKDTDGRAIAGAVIMLEDSGYPATTDSHGFASLPACSSGRIIRKLSIAASGYKHTSHTLISDMQSHHEVTLERNMPATRPLSATINAAELSEDAREKAESLQNRGAKAISHRDYENAEKLFLEALKSAPSSPDLANYLGIIALHKKDLNSAESWFQKASAQAPFQSTFLANLGYVMWLQKRPDESYELISNATARGYESAIAHFILGTVALNKGRHQETIYHLTKISAEEFPYRDLYLSIAFRNTGKTKSADDSYKKFLKRNPEITMNSLLLP
jgi:Tfp pilus assembly protein PilF